MSQIFLLLLFYNLLSLNLGEYEPPRSAAFPFGDEVFNADIKGDRVQEEARSLTIELIKDIYMFCPNTTEEEQLGNEVPYNDNLCLKCDVRPTVDKTGSLVECYNCTDASLTLLATQEEHQPDHLLFLTTYLEIRNYTAPDTDESLDR